MDPLAIRAYRIAEGALGAAKPGTAQTEGGFGEALGQALKQLQALGTEADATMLGLAAGQPIELHQAMLAMEEANLGFQLALQVRSKLLEAYQEIMRTQV